MEGNIQWVKSALCLARARGEDINCKDQDDVTGLMWALLKKHNSIVRLLLEQPTMNLNCTSVNGKTALHFAAQVGNVEYIWISSCTMQPRLATLRECDCFWPTIGLTMSITRTTLGGLQ